MLTSLKTRLNNYYHYRQFYIFLGVLFLGFILTTLFTWPMILNLPVFYSDQSDYTLVGWILWYNQHSFITGRIFSQIDYFNAFQFYPWPYALAFSEHFFIPALIFSPIYWISEQLVLSVNLYTFSTFILTFITSFYVFKKFLKSVGAALIAGLIFTFNPVTAAHFPGHTHLLGKFFLPIIFLTAVNYFTNPTLKKACLLSGAFTLNALTSINFFIISVPSLILTAIPFVLTNIFNKNYVYFKQLFLSSLGLLVCLPFLAYFLLPYQNFSHFENAQRGVDESIFFSAQPIDWLLPFPESLLYKNLVTFYDETRVGFPKINYSEHTLGLNIIPLLLFFIGALSIQKRKIITSDPLIIALFCVAIGTLLLTFGPMWGDIKLPYYYFNELTGLLNGIRVPTRFQFFFYIPFSILAGLGYLAIQKHLKAKSLVLIFVLFSLITLENINIWQFMSDTSSLTLNNPTMNEYRELKFLQDSTTIHLPAYSPDFEKQIYYLSLATIHKEKLVNGYSGYFPPEWVQLISQINTQLDINLVKKLSALKVKYLIFHKDRLEESELSERISQDEELKKTVIYNTPHYLIIDTSLLDFKFRKCSLAKDIDLKLNSLSQSHGIISTYFYQMQLTNKADCYFTNILNDRYQKFNLFVNGKSLELPVKLPVVVGPKEEELIK